jgi:probable phosphoglycerate mutase
MEQKWPSQLVIVRHGETDRNVAKDIAKSKGAHTYGSGLRDMDTLLTKEGNRQARATGEHLAKEYRFDAVFASPYQRTKQTADLIVAQMKNNLSIVGEERIREIEFGILDGRTTAGIKEKYPDEFMRREREGKYWYRPPGGENRPDVALRVHSFLGTLARDYREKNVLVVCHSVVVLVFRRLLERWGEEEYMKIDTEDEVLNCSVTSYRFDQKINKLICDFYNKIFHQRVG